MYILCTSSPWAQGVTMLNKKKWNTKFTSKVTDLTDISSPWWWHSRSAETCRRACVKCSWSFVYCVITSVCFLVYWCILFYCVCVYYFSCRMLARSQQPEGPTTGHLGTGFSWYACVYKRMLRWFPRLQVAIICFSCSPPDLNFLDP